MADEKDISLRVGLDTAEVEAGTARVKTDVAAIGTAGEEAGRKVAAGAKDAWDDLEQLGEEGQQAAAALRALGTSTSARELARNAGLAAFNVEDLTNKLKAAGPAGEASLGKLTNTLKAAEAAIGSAADKAGRMKDAAADLGQRSKMAGDSLETLRGSAGSLDTMLGRMRDTGTGATKVIGSLGVGAGIAVAGVMGAVAAGRQLAQVIDDIDARQARRDKASADSAVKAQLLDAANRAVTRGLIEQGQTSEETVGRYIQMTLRMGKLTEQGRAYIASVAEMKAPAAWGEIEQKAKAMADTLTGAYKRSEEEGNRWALANATGIKAIIAEYDRAGKTVPETLVAAITSAEQWAAANEKAAVSARAAGAAARQMAADAGTAFENGDLQAWAAAHAEAIISVVKSENDAGKATTQMSSVMQAAYKLAKEAVGANKLAVEEYARSAITKYAEIVAAQKASVDTARQSGADAIANFDAQMRALNEMEISEEEYSARKKQLYAEMNAAVSAAAQQEQTATKQSQDAQAALLASLSLSPAKYAEVGVAAGIYAEAIKAGATPTDAAAKASEALGEGLGKVQKSVETVTLAPLTEGMGYLGAASTAAITNVTGIVTVIKNIPADIAPALAALGELEAKFRAVAGASDAASGGGA